MLEERRQSAIRGCKVCRTNHVGAAALGYPVEQSSTVFSQWKSSGASLRRTDEGVCHHVVRGPCLRRRLFAAGLSFSILRILRRRSAGVNGF